MNRVELTGRLVRDPETNFVGQSQFPIVSLNVAVENAFGRWNRDTNKSEVESGFYAVEVLGEYGVGVAETANKGDQVYVLGSLTQFTREKGEEKTTHTRIRADVVQVLAKKRQEMPVQQSVPDPWGADPWTR